MTKSALPAVAGPAVSEPSGLAAGHRLARSAPHQQGVDAGGVIGFLDAVADAGIELHSLMLVRNGSVVAEGWWQPYTPDRAQLLYSLSKSVASTAVGLAIAEGLLNLDATLVELFPEHAPDPVDPATAAITLRHALTMTTGHYDDPVFAVSQLQASGAAPDAMAAFLSLAPDAAPGSVFTYNQLATYAAGRAVQQATGQRLSDYLRPRLFEPLGIEPGPWLSQNGVEIGYSGLHLTTEAVAAFGQLYLDGGQVADRQLLPAEWVAQATRPLVPSDQQHRRPDGPLQPPDWSQGYGFQFWQARHGYRGDGAYGQFCVVLPEQRTVLALTSCTVDMQAVLELAWRHLLPALGEPGPASAAVTATETSLSQRLSAAALPTPDDEGPAADTGVIPRASTGEGSLADAGPAGADEGITVRDGAPVVSPSLPGTVRAAQVVTAPHGAGRYRLRLTTDDAVVDLPVGSGDWAEGKWPNIFGADTTMMSAGGWSDGVFTAQLRMVSTPHLMLVTVDPAAGEFRASWRELLLHGNDPAHYPG